MILLECKNLEFGYGPTKGNLRGLTLPFDFELQEGQVVALLGANGSGKSTLLKTFAGFLEPLSGSIQLMGKSQWSVQERSRRVALVRMGNAPCDRMTVREFVSLGRMPYAGLFDGRNANDEGYIDQALALLELQSFENRQVSQLSDGERSRVYLAVAIAQQVKVLLLDEPNAFLDIPHSKKLFLTLRKLARECKMGIVVSTHFVEYAERYGDQMMVIADGKVQVAPAKEGRRLGLLDWTEIEDD